MFSCCMETSTTNLDGDGDIKQKQTTDRKILATKRNASNRRIFMRPGRQEKNWVKLGMKSSHAVYLRYRIGGGKTPARFRRFSSSTPTRLAEGLGPKRLSIANWRYAPETWVPRSRCFFGIRHIRNIFIHKAVFVNPF